MAWIEVHQTLPSHRKIKALKRDLKIKTPQAVGHMVMLWLWAVDNAPGGDLSGVDPDDIAEAAEWPKDGKVFVDAMIRAGFLDEDMQIHDWGDFSGMLMEKREAKRASDRERQRRRRDRLKKEAENSDAERDSHSPVTRDNTVMSRPCHAPNSTVPYSTVPNSTSNTSHPTHACAQEEALQAFCGPPQNGIQDQEFAKVIRFYLDRINPTPSTASTEELKSYLVDMQADVIIAAMQYALDEQKTTWSYIRGTLRGYHQRGIRTMDDLRRANAEYERQKRNREGTTYAGTRGNHPQRTGSPNPPPGTDPLRGFHQDGD